MKVQAKKLRRTFLILISFVLLAMMTIAGITIFRTWGRTVMQISIHQNRQLIYLSTFAEPPQFAIWLENPVTSELKTVFVTHRVAAGDWEGKANVPVALPRWFELFRGENSRALKQPVTTPDLVVSGATPKEDYFSVRAELKPGSEWICWIEMNLAGDFNDTYQEFDEETLSEDEFSNGQPALLFRADIKADEGLVFTPVITSQCLWNEGKVIIEPIKDGITSAKEVFDTIQITISRPKPKIVDKSRIEEL